MKIHTRQSSNCTFEQNEISTSTRFASINDIAFSSQVFYLIIKNLYHKQKVLLVKSEKFETMISTSSSLFIQSKLQFVASSESQTEFEFFKFNVFSNSIDFILFDVDDIIEFINQIVKSSQISYQHIVMTFFSIYEKRLITFTN